MELSKIHISSHKGGMQEKPCEFFKVNRYFSELTTDIDKARARYNLGIPDEFSLTWEAIAGKPDINNLLNTQKSSIIALYHLDTLAYDLQSIRSNILELLNLTLGLTSSKLLEVEKLWSDVARNSRDILALQGGGDTSIGTRLTAAETKLSTLETIVNNMSQSTYDDTLVRGLISALTTRVAALENGSSDLTDILNRLNAIEALLATDIVTGIRIGTGISTLNVTDSAGNQTIQIYAIHSKVEPVVITNSVTVNTNNASVAYWDTSLHQIVIDSQGTAVLTFSYDTWHETLTVNVTASAQPTVETTYYIGYAPASALLGGDVVGHNEFAVRNSSNTIDITGSDIYKYSGCDLGNGLLASNTYLFFCMPQGKSLQHWQEISNSESEQLYYQTYSNGIMLGDVRYNVYYINPASYSGLSYQFKIN